MMQALEPYFPATNIATTADFWQTTLGFEITGQSEGWLRVARDDVAVMFGAGTPPSDFDGILIVRTDDVNGVSEAADVPSHWGPRETADNRYEVAYRDPNGYIVNFTQNIDKAGDAH